MGLEIDREEFAPADYDRFSERRERCVAVLDRLLAQPGFGDGSSSLGAELEVSLVDADSRPLPFNEEVLRETLDERMTVELNRFNLECNLLHTDLSGRPFGHMRREIESAREELARAAALHGGRIAMIGILPTLLDSDLHSHAMTDAIRYRALSRSLREKRDGPFHLNIGGEDPLNLACDDVTYEGAATSFQIHLRVEPAEFTKVFNAAQIATAPALAASGNSPTFVGHRLWEETRIALFKQAVDDRNDHEKRARRRARVNFGNYWLEGGPIDLFREAQRDYPVLLPVLYEEDPEKALSSGLVPGLKEIRLHQGTVWHWNRPVYDPHDGGHVRIELRGLPSGPTTEDMLANAAFLIGLTLGIAPRIEEIKSSFGFASAHHNFYRAAQSGLDAMLEWPAALVGAKGPAPLRTHIETLGTIAREGLVDGGVDPTETNPLIDCVLERVARGQTGAVWQRQRLAALEEGKPSRDALKLMLEDYLTRSDEGEPVHRWGPM
jgi:hypothetical protein